MPVPRELPGLLKTNPVADASRKPSLLLVGDVDFGDMQGPVSIAKAEEPRGRQHRSAVRGPRLCF